MTFKDKTILITGASSGIGVGFARALARDGAHLILTARRADRLDELRESILKDHAVSVHCIPADLSDAKGVAALVSAVEQASLTVDILINNAGFGFTGAFAEAETGVYRTMNEVNMTSLTELCQAFMPGMAARGQGGVLNVASMAGAMAMPYFAVYAATKAYVVRLNQALWKEYLGSGVHVSALCPGPVDTEFFEVSGYNPANASISRNIQSVADVVEIGLIALRKNKAVAPTTVTLRILSFLQRFIPTRLSLHILASQMKSSVSRSA